MQQPVNWPGWEFVRKLGSGSYGEVYEILQKIGSFERHAALKIVPVPRDDAALRELYSLGYDEETVERSLREQVENVVQEFSVMFDLRKNAHIVHCEELRIVDRPDGEKGKDICMQMELLTPLAQMLNPADAQAQAIRVGADLLDALAFCRARKIVHRDIKPQNIFVSPDGDYKLGDFGVARSMDHTGSATMIGTINYMAPEVRNNEHYGAAADLYSLGMVLYWILNERHLPFVPILDRPPRQSEMEQAAARRFQGEAVPLPKHGGEALRRLVCSMCAFRPEERPGMETLREAFARLGDSAEPEPAPAPEPEIVKPEPTPVPAPEPEEDGTLGVWGTKQAPSKQPEKTNSENAYTFEKASSEHAYTFEKADDKTEFEPESLPKPQPQPKPRPEPKPQPQPEPKPQAQPEEPVSQPAGPASLGSRIGIMVLSCVVYGAVSVFIWTRFMFEEIWSVLPFLLAAVIAGAAYPSGTLGRGKRAALMALLSLLPAVLEIIDYRIPPKAYFLFPASVLLGALVGAFAPVQKKQKWITVLIGAVLFAAGSLLAVVMLSGIHFGIWDIGIILRSLFY